MDIKFSEYPYGMRVRISDMRWDYKMLNCHLHDWYEIFMVTDGMCKFSVRNNIYELRAGDVVILPPDMPHYPMSGEYTRIDIEITPEYLNTFFTDEAQNILLKCFDKEILHFSSSKTSIFKEYCREISSKGQDDDTLFVFIGLLLRMLCKESASFSKNNSPYIHSIYNSDNAKLRSVIDYIEENYKDIRSLDETARACYISKSHMCRMFRRELGVSVVDYVNSVKLRHACDKLANTSMSIVDIAVECGFNSSQYFSRIFKTFSGCTPQQYRKRTKGKTNT